MRISRGQTHDFSSIRFYYSRNAALRRSISAVEFKLGLSEMAPRQKVFLKWWLILFTLFFVVWWFQDNVWVVRGAFVSVVLYAIWNASELRELQGQRPTPRDVIRDSKAMQFWVIGALVTEIGTAMFFLLSGQDLGEYISGVGALALVILAPILPPMIVSQRKLFQKLGKEES